MKNQSRRNSKIKGDSIMKKIRLLGAVCAIMITLIATPANAEFVEVDLFRTGDKLLTRDTVTGLEWLDLTETTNLSVNDIVNGVNNTWYQDFQYATRGQYATLKDNVLSQEGDDSQNIFALMQMIGITFFSDNGSIRVWRSTGFVDPFAGDPTLADRGQMQGSVSTFSPFGASINLIEDNPNDDLDARLGVFGHYLIRTASIVPTLTCLGDSFESPFSEIITLKNNMKKAIPVKMALVDADGNLITDSDISSPPVVNVSYTPGTGADDSNNPDLVPPGLADDGNEFRFDYPYWLINLATKQFSSEGTYVVTAVAGDESYTIDAASCSGTFVRLP